MFRISERFPWIQIPAPDSPVLPEIGSSRDFLEKLQELPTFPEFSRSGNSPIPDAPEGRKLANPELEFALREAQKDPEHSRIGIPTFQGRSRFPEALEFQPRRDLGWEF